MGLFDKIFRRDVPPKHAIELTRNDTCWCGSGLKYKKCHYQNDQQHFSRVRNEMSKGSYKAR